MRISEFIFERGNIVSIYGVAGSGKTNIVLQVLSDILPSLYISTEGKSYQARLTQLRGKKDMFFVEVYSVYELISSLVKGVTLNLKLIAVDSINRFYRETRREKDLLYPLTLLLSISRETNAKILLSWQVSGNNKVSGEKYMRKFSDDVLRITKNYIIGNLRACKFKITEEGVIGCL